MSSRKHSRRQPVKLRISYDDSDDSDDSEIPSVKNKTRKPSPTNPELSKIVKKKSSPPKNASKPEVDNLPNPSVPNTITTNVICDNEDKFLKEHDTHYIYIYDANTKNFIFDANTTKNKTRTSSDIQTRRGKTLKWVRDKIQPVFSKFKYGLFKKRISDIDKHKVLYNDTDNKIIAKLNERITQSCNKKNIIIYILLQNKSNTNEFLNKFNRFLQVGLAHKYYSNIIIISFFQLTYVSPPYYGITKFKSLLVSNVMDQTVNFKKFFKVLNVHCHQDLTDFKYITEKKNGHPTQQLSYQLMMSGDLYDYDYIKTLLSERKCSTGKLKQFTGTCWMNSIMNSMLLPKKLRFIMMLQCKKYIRNASSEEEKRKYMTPLFEIYESRNTLTIDHIITSIVYHIFIKKERLIVDIKDENNPKYDFILVLADKMKRLYYHHGNNQTTLMPIQKERYKNNDIAFGNGGIEEVRQFSMQYIERIYLIDYRNKILVNYYPEIDEEDVPPYDIDENEKTIIVNGETFKLTSALLIQRGLTHVICGFICEDKEYVYDPNFFKAFETKWTKNDYSDYVSTYKFYMEQLIYVKETITEDSEKEDELEIQSMQEKIPIVPCLRAS
jgi:hypothetical protein